MSATYKPGDVAMVSALNRPEPYRAYFDGKTWREYGFDAFCVDTPATIRPLVVLDLGSAVPEVVVNVIRKAAYNSLADQIEAQTKPPRIPEPGLWGVVEATALGLPRRRWVHHEEDRWVCDTPTPSGVAYWADLLDPVLVRDGIEDES